MDDLEMARLAVKAVRTAARLAEQEQRRRERVRQQAAKEAAAQRAKSGVVDDRSTPQRRPEFAMPANAGGEIPDEFLPQR
jgi:hypothetical protein